MTEKFSNEQFVEKARKFGVCPYPGGPIPTSWGIRSFVLSPQFQKRFRKFSVASASTTGSVSS